MSDGYTMTLEADATPEDLAAVRAGLSAYNRRQAGDDSFEPIDLIVRDAAGAVAGGLLGGTYWGWLVIEILWLADELRGQGWGSRLLRAAEQIAVERGCHAAHLDTMSFQARPFYERHGYAVFGVLEDLPRGHQRYFMQKRLAPAPPERDPNPAHNLS
ncbi:MAG TPA: GNAT family N-acetyltransferase [Roseiflexaceae bacterium]